MHLIDRTLHSELIQMSQQYPVVTVIGPRQSGKTTLVRNAFPQKPYVSLENPDERVLAESDPRGFLERFPEGAILDEIQRLPSLLSYLQGIVDEKQIKGLFILTGSHQLQLHESISQSLAGRTAILKLLPFDIRELSVNNIDMMLDEYLLKGMYPRIYKDNINPTKFYRDYVQTYVERDVRHLLNIKDLSLFQQFLKLCAGRIGQVFNSNALSNEIGVSHHTILNWLSILEASFLVFRLQPYFENFGKRIIKSPKLYFTDVGLASYLLDITSVEQVTRDPLRGNLVENLIISEFYKEQFNQGREPSFYYYRDSNQNEVDMIIKFGNELIPIEIKPARTFNISFLKGLKYFSQVAQSRYVRGYLVYAGDQEQAVDSFYIFNFKRVGDILDLIYST